MRLLVTFSARAAVVPGDGEHAVLRGRELSRQAVATRARFGTGVPRQRKARVIAIGAAIVALIAGAGTYLLTHGGGIPPHAPVSPGGTPPRPLRGVPLTPAPGAPPAGRR